MDEQPSTVPKIYGAIAAIMKETKAITKSSRNQQQGFMFRGIDAVMNELHDLFANNGVFILPEVLDYTVAEKVTGKGTILIIHEPKSSSILLPMTVPRQSLSMSAKRWTPAIKE